MTTTMKTQRTCQQSLARAISAEWFQLKHDSGGRMILTITVAAAVLWSMGISNLMAGFGGVDTSPSERAAVSGVFQVAVLGLFVWVARNMLREEATHFAQLKQLSMPSRPVIWLAKWLCLTVVGAAAMLTAVVVSTAGSLASLALMGRDWQQFVGPDGLSYLVLAGNALLLAVVGVAVAVGVSVLTNNFGTAVAVLIGWILVVEGMVDASDPGTRIFYNLLPFKNATRVFEQAPAEKFLWAEPVSLTYALIITVAFAGLAIYLNRAAAGRGRKGAARVR